MLKEKLLNKQSGIVLYGMTPPKNNLPLEKIADISQRQYDRLKNLDIDGLIFYDIQEEAERADTERPFPFLPTIDPSLYSSMYLKGLHIPQIIYRSVGKYSKEQLSEWIQGEDSQDRFTVYVGASSSRQQVSLSLSEAYELSSRLNDRLLFGGVVIPERHTKYNDEHLRVIRKVQSGCSFFVSQATYDVEASKNFLSDYYYYCQKHEMDMVPILINLAPCGSLKTMDFMKWLGISIPKWLENELTHSQDILDKSVALSLSIYEELLDFGASKGIPLGCSVESVSTRKVEIEASIELLKSIRRINKGCLTVH